MPGKSKTGKSRLFNAFYKHLSGPYVLALLARLGLRAGEVVRLQLDDIDWRAGNVLIRAGKTRRERVLRPDSRR